LAIRQSPRSNLILGSPRLIRRGCTVLFRLLLPDCLFRQKDEAMKEMTEEMEETGET
jgi:hypothetical protein